MVSYIVVFTLLGSLALLMFGMKTLSEGLQKMAGPQLRNVLQKMTANRFMGAVTGMFVTANSDQTVIGVAGQYKVRTTLATDGDLTIGIKFDNCSGNWAIMSRRT